MTSPTLITYHLNLINMSEKLKIEIPVKKYIKLIDSVEKDSLDIADKVHITMLNHMIDGSVKKYFNERYKVK